MNTKKYYFLPFVDNLKAVGIAILAMFIFGSWMTSPYFGVFTSIVLLITLCGFIYSRMWKLTRKNELYKLGLRFSDYVKFILPLVIFEIVLITFYCLCEAGVIPLSDIVVNTYYTFPDNAPREAISVSCFDYVGPAIKIWFSYMLGISKHGAVLFIAPVLSFLSALLGYKFGTSKTFVQELYIKFTEKIKNKFNE